MTGATAALHELRRLAAEQEPTRYHVENLDHVTMTGDRRVRCECGGRIFTTPEPPTDRFYTGRFTCAECARRWNTQDIVQRLAFVAL